MQLFVTEVKSSGLKGNELETKNPSWSLNSTNAAVVGGLGTMGITFGESLMGAFFSLYVNSTGKGLPLCNPTALSSETVPVSQFPYCKITDEAMCVPNRNRMVPGSPPEGNEATWEWTSPPPSFRNRSPHNPGSLPSTRPDPPGPRQSPLHPRCGSGFANPGWKRGIPAS
jgi:hypothetical protein